MQETVSNKINAQLEELGALWVNPISEALQRIPALCDEIAAACAPNEARINRELLCRAGLLSIKAQTRLMDCLAIQIRTGSYSTTGALEASPRVATLGWEG
jgi:hypothetical protein